MTHLLHSCWAKVQRASETIENFKSEVDAFILDPNTYSVTREFRNNGLEYAFLVKGNPAVPVRLSVLAGEPLHHLRSALDWLVCALVLKNGGAPNRQHAFPICTTIENFEQARSRGCIQGLSVSAANLIRAQQPYLSPTPDLASFHVLSELNRQDKHRLPLAASATAQIGSQLDIGCTEGVAESPETIEHGYVITGLHGLGQHHQITEEGTKVFWLTLAHASPSFKADAQVTVEIAFEQCGSLQMVPAIPLLVGLRDTVANVIHSFVSEFS